VRSVLVLAYYFPPIGGAGAQRPAAFVRHLPRLGYDPTVVTGPGTADGRWTPRDDTLLAELPLGTEVRRVPGPEPAGSSGWRNRAERYLGLETAWARWWIHGSVATGRGTKPDLVYAWMSPFESAAAASLLARELDRPWVADLGDPWALDEMMVYPTSAHRRRALREMRTGLASAAAIVMSTPEAVVRVREAFPELDGTPVVAVPNGFDASDFAGTVPAREDGVFRIVHTGYFHTELGLRQRRATAVRGLLGGTVPGVDFLTRSHVYLLEAVDRLLAQNPALAGRLEVHLAGVLSEVDREIAGRSPVTRLHGYLSHEETLTLIRTADLLFLPMQNLPAGTRAGIVPGKTYEYLAAGRPILAAVPDGDARALLAEAGGTRLCRPDDVAGLAAAVAAELTRAATGAPPRAPRREVVERYEYRRLTGRLAEVFDAVSERAGVARRAA
jgi:glycosyltransferase involved in cell wall biosynthesis